MGIPGLDPERCRLRNAGAARRGLNAAGVRLFVAPPAGPAGMKMTGARGKLPGSVDEALGRINRMRGRGAEPLGPGDVWIVYPEAANSNFVGDRWLFLDPSTLKNVAAEANDGFAFMNSHRTGGMSTPTELPYGRTFAGRYETWADGSGDLHHRTLLGVYMLRGEHPNGASGPSTDALYRGIDGGTIADVSLGLHGGTSICDVCGNELTALDLDGEEFVCPHLPGTHRAMTEAEVAAQRVRGVPDGKASYSLVDAHAGEVSAVFAGAVPGAGFRKALSLARAGRLETRDRAAAGDAYVALCRAGDLIGPRPRSGRGAGAAPGGRPSPPEKGTPMSNVISAAELFKFWQSIGAPAELDLESLGVELAAGPEAADPGARKGAAPAGTAGAAPAQPPPETAPGPVSGVKPAPGTTLEAMQAQLLALETQLREEREAAGRERDANRKRAIEAEAKAFVADMVRQDLALPAERADLESEYVRAALDDAEHPTRVAYRDPADNTPKLGTRVDALRARYGRRSPHRFTREAVAGVPEDATRALATLRAGGADPGRTLDDVMGEAARTWALRMNGPRNGATAARR